MAYPGSVFPGVEDFEVPGRRDSYGKMWFGTFDHMEWIDAPLRGADVSPEGWNSSGTLLNGGSYVNQSGNSHRTYNFEWRQSSSRQMAQKMQDYRNGVYSKTNNLLYFVDPLTYTTNMLPNVWANPAVSFRAGAPYTQEDFSHPFGRVRQADTSPALREGFGLPVRGVEVLESAIGPSELPDKPSRNVLYSPLPGFSLNESFSSGYTLFLLLFWGEGISNTRGFFTRAVYSDGSLGPETPSLSLDVEGVYGMVFGQHNSSKIVGLLTYFKGSGFKVYGAVLTSSMILGKEVGGDSLEWTGGQGHSGCLIDGNPTYINTSGVNGGQIGYGAMFKEVGSWIR